MNHALIVLQFVACRRQLGLGFTNFIIKPTQTAAMRWIGDVHLVVLELRELFSCETILQTLMAREEDAVAEAKQAIDSVLSEPQRNQ